MQNILYMFWSSFQPYEQQLIRGIRNGIVTREDEAAQYLYIHNMADSNGLTGNWLSRLDRIHAQEKLTRDGDYLFWAGNDITETLTNTEQTVLHALLQKKAISRDAIAEILWGKQKDDRFSDWAIDKAVSRIRTKLSEAGAGKNYIRTLRGRGYTLQD
ncbi:MAG: DNA-binding transcriptional regulator CpxR [candidate division WS6 bacterium OLB20]|uniref:DNA-binding transcriptional regulator CpxR n=1 Tax=candidate division WS6 bacterium OLB20 TaxID=1617426 RepID=A0A136M0K7_9BACT|nr:MAG: DNA-binding transcriptional regulator CpxR [candidate division WS6 bacterium OLB20]